MAESVRPGGDWHGFNSVSVDQAACQALIGMPATYAPEKLGHCKRGSGQAHERNADGPGCQLCQAANIEALLAQRSVRRLLQHFVQARRRIARPQPLCAQGRRKRMDGKTPEPVRPRAKSRLDNKTEPSFLQRRPRERIVHAAKRDLRIMGRNAAPRSEMLLEDSDIEAARFQPVTNHACLLHAHGVERGQH